MNIDIGDLLKQEGAGFLQFGGARMALLDIESGFWSIRRQMESLLGKRLTNSILQQAGTNGGASFANSFYSDQINERPAAFQACLLAYQTAGFGKFELKNKEWPLGRLLIHAQDTFEAWMVRKHSQHTKGPVCTYTAGVLVGFINVITGRKDVVCIERSCQAQGAEVCVFELLPADKVGDHEQVVAFNPDPGLSRQINLLELLFDHMPMGIAVIDRDFILRRCNPTWAKFIEQYTPSKSIEVAPGKNIFDLEPGTEEVIIPLFNRVFEGETIRQEALRIESGGTVSYWDIVLAPLYENDRLVGLLNVSIDATDRVQAEGRLKETLALLERNESLLRSVIENAQHFAVYRVQVDPTNPYFGKVELVSPSMRELTGIDDPYCFEKWFENLHPDDYPRIVEANRRSLEEGAAYNQTARFFNAKENNWHWLHTISNPGFDAQGKLTHFDGMVIDLTEQKEAEQALQESQRKLSTLISNLPGMAYRCRNDSDWTMEFVSEGSLDLTGYRPEDLIESRRISYGALIHPEDRDSVWNQVQSALNKGHPFQMTYRIVTSEREKWVWEQGQGVSNAGGEVIALEGFITDITERVMAQQHLEQRVDERTHELTTLLDISHDLASTLDLEPLLDLILDQLGTVVDYDAASIMILEKETLKILAYRGPVAREEALEISFSVNKAKANHEVIKRREPVIIEDIRGEDDLARAIRDTAGDELETTYSYMRCWMGVPLIVKDQIVGMLTLDHQQPGYYAPTQAELAMAFASQAALAIENARLYFETERRADESETLFSVQQAITSQLEMDEVLQMISDEARRLTNTDISAVYLLKGDELEIAYVSGDVSDSIRGYRLAVEGSIAGRVVKNRTAILVPDTWADPRVDREAADQVQARSLLIVPLESGEEIIGTITVANRTPGGFSQEDKRLLTTLAANVVIALENARLYGQAEQAAVAQERNRLARDLHDAVTQTLFSASLIADVLPKLWQRNPDMGQQKLEELRLLTRGALSEMRTLLFELRPDMLGDVDLADLYRHLANAFTGRTRIPVIYTQEGQSELQPVVKETFYRIAQEALNNINKHAEASQVQIQLTQDEERVEVIIQDDGCGFDMRSLSPENMGLKIMRERAEAVAAEIDINSTPGAGTHIHMYWKAREEDQ